MTKKTALLLILFAIICSLIPLSFWANGQTQNLKGLIHLTGDYQGNLYLIIENYILKSSPEGKLLKKLDLKKTLGTTERIDDMLIKENGVAGESVWAGYGPIGPKSGNKKRLTHLVSP